ncbi:MAG: OsmC family protein [Gemmatimonadales bacterium]
MAADKEQFTITLKQISDYRFEVDFGREGVPDLQVDELPPLGGGAGPNPVRVLAASVGHCLAASLLFCLRKAHIAPAGVDVTVDGTMVRNERGRLRVGGLAVRLALDVTPEERERMTRCVDVFEDYCIITASVRQGIPVEVLVE